MPTTEQRSTNAPKKVTAPLGRGQLEAALKKALAAGPVAFSQQVRYILALSQMTSAQSVTTAYPERALTISQARITALADLAESLSRKQIKALLVDVGQIDDDSVRLPLVVRLALQLPPEDYHDMIHTAWQQARNLKDPLIRTRIVYRLAPLISLIEDEPATSSDMLEVIALAQSINNTEARVRSLVALSPHLPPAMSIRLLNRVLDDVEQANNDTLRSNTVGAMAGFLPAEIEERVLDTAERIQSPMERARGLTALARTLSAHFQPRLREVALDAIMDIQNEEDRAAALITFAPNLEYATQEKQFPILLEKALSIAVSMTRRHLRARVLVALAPHLTLDLQGEALAAVHSLSAEQERAALLAELAPTLPPEMLVASLAVAHTMREQDARVHALSILAHYVPEHARSQTMLDALAAAANLPHHFERVTALTALVDILPPQLQEQALTNALETTRMIENENTRSRALGLVSHHLPPHLLGRALDAAYHIDEPQQRLNALISISPALSVEQQADALRHMLETSRKMPFEYKQARALVSIASHLNAEITPQALELADTLEDPFDRASVYIALAQNLPPKDRPQLISKAWALIKKIDDGYDRASTLAAIAPFLPSTARTELSHTAGMVIGSIMDEYDQASAISILAPLLVNADKAKPTPTLPNYPSAIREAILYALNISQQGWRVRMVGEGMALWAELNEEQRYEIWNEFAPRLCILPLADVLLILGALVPVIRTLVTPETLIEIAQILGVR